MDSTLRDILKDDTPTKQKIMICALDLFSSKGYSETTIRDIASAVGITSGSIYGHFSSKEEIIQFMLNDYAVRTKDMFRKLDIVPILQKKPTGEGITSCVMKSISILTDDLYYGSLVHLIHQEQHRIALFGSFVLLRLQDTIDFVERVFSVLKDMNVISANAAPKYWGFYAYSVLHLVPTCEALKKVQKTSGYSIKDLAPMLCKLFDAMIVANKPIAELGVVTTPNALRGN